MATNLHLEQQKDMLKKARKMNRIMRTEKANFPRYKKKNRGGKQQTFCLHGIRIRFPPPPLRALTPPHTKEP
jgi:hypothetical protein